MAACTLFSKHKARDVYSKACGVEGLWGEYVIGDVNTGLFAGVGCPGNETVGECVESVMVEEVRRLLCLICIDCVLVYIILFIFFLNMNSN